MSGAPEDVCVAGAEELAAGAGFAVVVSSLGAQSACVLAQK